MRRFRVQLPWQLPAPLRPQPRHLRLARPIHASANSGARQGKFLLPGASAAALLMLGVLHAKRMYDDRKLIEQKERGVEPEFSTDLKASFLRLLPLRSMSRFWGSLMEVEVPVFMRPAVYKAWARAFHSDLEESALPLEEYPSLQAFFVRSLKEGSRPIDTDPNCLVSPVDGKVLRLGQLRGPGTMIEQVKGFSYPVSSLLGVSSSLHDTKEEDDVSGEQTEQNTPEGSNAKSWWRLSVASPKLRDQTRLSPKRGIFYCVLYLHPGDYHRVHSPADWNILKRRHFSGNLFPTNERAVRTIRNLYVENERVVLEGRWKEGFVAIAAVGATNVGSIKLLIEPELRTNSPGSRLVQSQPYSERVYGPEGTGVMVKKGEEIAGFNMGSTVVVVFEAPLSKAREDGKCSWEFDFCVKAGDRVRVGEAIGRWNES